MAEQKNWWEEDIPAESLEPTVSPETTIAFEPVEGGNWWEQDMPADEASPASDLRGDQEYPKDLDTLTQQVGEDAQLIDAAAAIQPDTVVGPEMWDAINNDPEYQAITDFEKTWGRVYTLDDLDKVPDPGTLPPGVQQRLSVDKATLKAQFDARELKKKELFSKIGTAEKDPSVLDSLYTGWDYKPRKQYKMEPNIDFDPKQPESEVNQRHKMSEYYVPPPDQHALISMGYQVARNLAGLGDMAYDAVVNQELNLSEEGPLRSNMPQNPMRATDKFIADMTSYALGPELAVSTLGKTAKTAAKVGDLAADSLKYISPTTLEKAKAVYKSTLAKGGSHSEAFEASKQFMSRVTVGTAIGLSEAAIAEDDSEGLISADFIQERTGMNARDAHDLSLFLDSPVISGTIGTLGTLWSGGANLTEKTLGGIKYTKAGKRLEMSKKEAGFRLLEEIDPQLFADGPELAVYRVKVLSDLLMDQGSQTLKFGDKSQTVKNDLSTANIRSAQQYFRQAYAFKEEEMGAKEFSEWVTQQASDSANRIVSLKTALSAEAPIEASTARAKNAVQDLYEDVANSEVSSGNLEKTQKDLTDSFARDHTNQHVVMDSKLEELQYKRDVDKENYENGFKVVPEIRDRITQARTDFELGTHTPIDEKFNKEILQGKTYDSFKKMYDEKNNAFNKIKQNKAIKADVPAFLEKLKEVGFKSSDDVDLAEDAFDQVPTPNSLEDKLKKETQEFLNKKKGDQPVLDVPEETLKYSDPVFKEIGDMVVSDGSYSNMLVNVHNKIQTRIKQLRRSKVARDQDLIDRLQDLDDHIQGEQPKLVGAPPEFQKDIDDAYNKFISYKTSWEDLDQMKELSLKGKDRANAENAELAKGNTEVGQGVSNWNDTARRLWEQEKLNPSGEFVRNLIRASKAGGNDITNEVADVIEMQMFRDFDNKTLTGDQSMRSFRGILRNHIDTLKTIAPDRMDKFVRMENELIKLEKSYKNSEEAFGEFQKTYNQFKTEMDNTVAAKFVYEVRNGSGKGTGKFEGVENPQKEMDKIFRASTSGNQLKELLRKTDEIGGKRGQHIRESLKGSFIDYVRRNTFGNTQSAFAPSKDGIKASTDVRSKGLKLSEDETVRNNMRLLYGDKGLQDFIEIENYLDDATRTFDRGKMMDQRHAPQHDPQKGVVSAITFALGVLNPKATMAKRIAGPWAELSSEQLKDAKKAALLAAMSDLPTATKFMKMRPEELVKKMREDEFKRFVGRAYLNTEFKEKDRDFKVPPGIK